MERRAIGLLTAITVLLCILVLMVAGGGLWAYGKVRQLGLAREAQIRQSLAARADKTAQETESLRRRREQFSRIKGGPVDKLNQAIELMQIMTDEMSLLLDHVSESQAIVTGHKRERVNVSGRTRK